MYRKTTMRMLMAIGFLAVGLAMSVLPSASQADGPANLPGAYDVLGTTATNEAYQGQVTISALGRAFELAWSFGGGLTHSGIGLQADKIFGAAFTDSGDPVGIVIYRIDGGYLRGVWSFDDSAKLGQETLLGDPALKGRYEIERGVNPDGSEYNGEVAIRRQGEVYLVDWSIAGDVAQGIGIRHGDYLVVGYGGYGADKRPGIVVYDIAKGEDGLPRLTGYWTYGEASGLGKEALRRRP